MQKKRFKPDNDGEFPEWVEVTLGECADFSRGKGLTKNDITENGRKKCILYGQLHVKYGTIVQNVIDTTNAEIKNPVISKSGDILISGTISAGLAKATCIKEDGVIIGGDINILRPKKNIDGEFLARVINANTDKFKRYLEGSVILHLRNENIKKISIKIPKSIEEQRKIAHALAAFDEMIAVKTKKMETYQELKKTMLKDIFGRTKRFKADDGSEFPEWEEKTLKNACEINVSKQKPEEKFVYIELVDVDEHGILKHKNIVDKTTASVRAQRVAEVDDVFFRSVRPGNKGHFHYTKKMPEQVVTSSAFYQLRMKNGDNEFLYQAINTDCFCKQVVSKCTGTAYPAISLKEFSELKIKIPKSIDEQHKIGSFLAEIDKMIAVQKEFIDLYTELKRITMRDIFK